MNQISLLGNTESIYPKKTPSAAIPASRLLLNLEQVFLNCSGFNCLTNSCWWLPGSFKCQGMSCRSNLKIRGAHMKNFTMIGP